MAVDVLSCQAEWTDFGGAVSFGPDIVSTQIRPFATILIQCR